MKRNVELNGLGPSKGSTNETPVDTPSDALDTGERSRPADANARLGKVRVNEGDAWYASLVQDRPRSYV